MNDDVDLTKSPKVSGPFPIDDGSIGREHLRAVDHAAWRVAQLIVLATALLSVYSTVLLGLRLFS
jgi:hypothetical protein